MKIGIVGATGVVGATILEILDERRIAVDALVLYASRERDEPIAFRGKPHRVVAATREALERDRCDVVFFASSDDASAELAQVCVRAGGVVIDNSSTFRMDPACPLVVPEVNPGAIDADARIYPVANCTAIVLCVGIAPLVRTAGVRSIHVATYQAVSGAGRAGLDALANEENAAFRGGTAPFGSPFSAEIFRNVVPQIGSFDANGDSGEEKKVAAETRRILDLASDVHIAATTVRVPVRRAHSEAVFVETRDRVSLDTLRTAYRDAPGVVFHDEGIVTPRDVEGSDLVHVARLRSEGDTEGRWWQLWIVGDQLRKGAATNGVQIFEALLGRGAVGRHSAPAYTS